MNVSANTVTPNSGVCSPAVTPETLRGLYDIDCAQVAGACLAELADDLTDPDRPAELSKLARSLRRWHTQIINWHGTRITNGPTEAVIICSASQGVVDVADRRITGSSEISGHWVRAEMGGGLQNRS